MPLTEVMPQAPPIIPQAYVSLALVPESFTDAVVHARWLAHQPDHPTVSISVAGLSLRTFRCNPDGVTAALRALADRIDAATRVARHEATLGDQQVVA